MTLKQNFFWLPLVDGAPRYLPGLENVRIRKTHHHIPLLLTYVRARLLAILTTAWKQKYMAEQIETNIEYLAQLILDSYFPSEDNISPNSHPLMQRPHSGPKTI